MYNLASICFMCLTESKCLKTLYNNEQENDAAKQIRYILPEIRITDLKISVHICCGCHTAIQNFHSFKTRCLDNYYRLINYINTSQAQQANTIHAVIPPPQTVCVVPPPQPVCVVPPPQPVCVIPPPQPVCVVPPPQTICAVVPPKEKNIEKVQPAQDRDIDFIELEKEDPLLSFGRREDLNLLTEDMDIKEELFDSEESDEDDSFQPIQFIKCEVSDDQQDSSVSSASKNDLLPIDITMEDFECPTCKKKFSRHRDYKEHMKSYHADSENTSSLNALPEKSRRIYEKAYKEFLMWCKSRKVKDYSENVILAYFHQKANSCKASTLWSYYSMLKATMIIHHDIDIGKYKKLCEYLKRKNDGYKPQKSKVLSREQIETFMLEAPDDTYLMMKVATIFGIAGGCRREELTQLTLDDMQYTGSALYVTIRDSNRIFTVEECKGEPINFLEIYRRFAALREPKTDHRRFFVAYKNGKCSTLAVGINSFGRIPKEIATFLKLPDAELYTGHCFRSLRKQESQHEGYYN